MQRVAQWRVSGKKIVFTNGVFDIIHQGHIYSLSQAAKEADYLIIGLNADASVKRLKGIDRPINNQDARALVLASLVMTDAVVLFEETEFRFSIEQTGIVQRFERIPFHIEPEADGDLRAVEELAGEGDHAVHEVGFDEFLSDVAFTGLVGGHAAIGEDEAGHAVGREARRMPKSEFRMTN